MRSKSDVTHGSERDRFFDTLGLEASAWRKLLLPPQSTSSDPSRYFATVSSVDSGPSSPASDEVERAQQTSIVEKNARVIKWLFNCRRAVAGS